MKSQKEIISDDLSYFVKKDWSDYAGQWVAIFNNQIISHNEKLKKVIKETSAICITGSPTFTKIPEKDSTLLL